MKLLGVLLLLLLLTGGAYAIGTAPANLTNIITYQKFNNNSSIGENSTKTVDTAGFFNGTINNATFNATGGILGDGALIFDGVTSYVNFGNVINMNYTDFSICAWAMTRRNDSSQYIATKYPGGSPEWSLYQENDGTYNFFIRNASGTNVRATQFTFRALNNVPDYVCGVYNGTSGKIVLYVNGLPESTPSTVVLGNFSNNANMNIGRRTNGQSYYNGSIDEVMIYNRTLTHREIWGNFQNYVQYVVPRDNMIVQFSTNLTNGTYYLNDTDQLGVIKIQGSNLTLDCNGGTIIGNDSSTAILATTQDNNIGIYAQATYSNVYIKNCNVYNYSTGIYLRSANSTAYNNTILYGNTGVAIQGNGSNATNNTIRTYNYGIETRQNIYYNAIINNTLNNISWDGLQIRGAYGYIAYNTINDVEHHAIDVYSQTSDGGNIFEYNLVNHTVGSNNNNPYSHYTYLYRANHNIFRHNTFVGGTGIAGYGIEIAGNPPSQISINNSFINNTFDNITIAAIGMIHTDGNSFINNTFTNYNQSTIEFQANAANTTFIDQNLNIFLYGNMKGFLNSTSTYTVIRNTNIANSTTIYISALDRTLAYSTNGSSLCLNISGCTQVNSTTPPNTTIYFLKNFNVTEGVQRNFSPMIISGSANTRSITSILVDSIANISLYVSTAIVPSSPRVTWANGTSENPTYSYDNIAGVMSFSSSIPSGVSTLQISTAAGPDLGCVQFSTQERALFIAGIVGALALVIFLWYSNPAMLINISLTVGIVFFITVLGAVIRGMC